jgi:hypothetical protein
MTAMPQCDRRPSGRRPHLVNLGKAGGGPLMTGPADRPAQQQAITPLSCLRASTHSRIRPPQSEFQNVRHRNRRHRQRANALWMPDTDRPIAKARASAPPARQTAPSQAPSAEARHAGPPDPGDGRQSTGCCLSAFPRPDGQIARSGRPPNHKVRPPCARRLPTAPAGPPCGREIAARRLELGAVARQ